MTEVVTTFFDVIFSPFERLPKLYGLILLSVVLGVILVLLYSKLSNQSAIKRTKKGIFADLLEAVLYRHDVRVSLKAQLSLFIGGVRYFLLAIPPILILAIPSILLLSQINIRYGYSPLKVGEDSLLRVDLEKSSDNDKIIVTSDPDIDISARVRVDDQLYLRIRPKTPGLHTISIKEGGRLLYSSSIPAAVDVKRVDLGGTNSAFYSLLFATKTIAGPGVVREVQIDYPSVGYVLFNVSMHWLVLFLIVSIGSGIVASKYLGIEI